MYTLILMSTLTAAPDAAEFGGLRLAFEASTRDEPTYLDCTPEIERMEAEIAKLSNPFLLHYPLTDDEPQATFAFPFSPAEIDRGPHYAFCLHHVLTLDDPMEAFRLEVFDA